MLDEKKICLMTKLARFESRTGKESLRIIRHHRGDYIGMGLLRNFFETTLGYLLVWGVIIAYNMDYLLDNLHKVKIFVVVVEFIVGYLIFLILYSVITWIKRRRQYEQAREEVEQYYNGLEELSRRYYGAGGKEKTGKTAGGKRT
ncbi:MAG TPA: hypothetical protein IAA03_08755 [Candidatus Ruminococcus avistercoris]|nr:hypothetical protein [Candidatus Ruminococcus avistercoris]